MICRTRAALTPAECSRCRRCPRLSLETAPMCGWRACATVDANSDGVIDADELAAVAAAVNPLSGDDSTSKDASFYGALMEKALARSDDSKADADTDLGQEAMQLDFAAFLRLMSSKAVADFRNPESELKPAFSGDAPPTSPMHALAPRTSAAQRSHSLAPPCVPA